MKNVLDIDQLKSLGYRVKEVGGKFNYINAYDVECDCLCDTAIDAWREAAIHEFVPNGYVPDGWDPE